MMVVISVDCVLYRYVDGSRDDDDDDDEIFRVSFSSDFDDVIGKDESRA